MAGIDSSIYFNQQTPDIMGSVQKGLSMRDMLDEKKKKQAIDAAYQAGLVKNEDGSTSFDGNKTMASMSGIQGAGREAAEFSQQQKQMSAAEARAKQEKQMRDIDLIARVAPEIKDQQSYEGGIAYLSKMGVDVSQMPRAYDPGLVNRYGSMALTYKEKMEQQNKDRDFDLKEKELGIKRKEVNKKEGKTSGALEGRKALDKDYAKDYNDWTTSSRNAALKNLERLKEAKAALEKDDTLTGPGRGLLPDVIRNYTNENAILNRDKVRAAAQGALKATLGSAFTEQEGERIMNQSYNERLSPKANIDLIDKAIKEIEGNMFNSDTKAAYFQKNGTLDGLDLGIQPTQIAGGLKSSPVENPNASPKTQSVGGGMVKVIAPDGSVKKVPESRLQELLNAGAKLAPQTAGY